MKNVYCPNCKKLLFKAKIANIEVMCHGCKRLVTINFVTSEGLMGASLINYEKDAVQNEKES